MFRASSAHLQEDTVVHSTQAVIDKSLRTLIECDSTICCMCTTISSWRWAFEARNM